MESFESGDLKNFEEYDKKKVYIASNTLSVEIWMLLVKAQKEERKFQRNPKQFRKVHITMKSGLGEYYW